MRKIEKIHKPDGSPMSVAVFLSGSGTNLVALYEEQKRLELLGEKNYGRIEVVFTNVPGCRGAEIARGFGIPVICLSSKSYFDILGKTPDDEESRNHYDAATLALIEEISTPRLILLAGYRRRLSGLFIDRYRNRILNLYPGDTTKPYLVRGVDAPIQALRAGERTTKCTVFFVKEGERFGPVLIQSQPISIEGLREEDIDEIQDKIRREGEWRIFPFAVHHLIARGRVGIDGEGNVYVDGAMMPKEGYQFGSDR